MLITIYLHNPQHVIHLPSLTSITTQPDTFEWWNMLKLQTWWILFCIGWLSLRSRIQTQHDLKSLVYQSLIVPLLLECLKYTPTREACPWVREIFEIYCLPSPMPARGVAIYNRQSDPCYCSLPQSPQLLPSVAGFVSWPYLCLVQPCAVYQRAVSWWDPGTPQEHNMPGHSLGQINQPWSPKKSLRQINQPMTF